MVDEGQGFRRPELVDGRRGVREEYRVNAPSRKSYIYYSKYYYLIAERYYLIAERKRDKERIFEEEEEEEEEEESFVLIEGEKCVHFNSKRGTSSFSETLSFPSFFLYELSFPRQFFFISTPHGARLCARRTRRRQFWSTRK